MLWCCRDLAKRTSFGGRTLFEPYGCLVPGPDVVGLAGTECFSGLLGYGPVNAADQRLAVFPAGKTALVLLFGFRDDGFFNLPPRLAEVDVGLCHEGCFIAMPLVEAVGAPSPFV